MKSKGHSYNEKEKKKGREDTGSDRAWWLTAGKQTPGFLSAFWVLMDS